ncbi:MAG: 1-acyl-sn-glycerol-3-phosphate acyltransferase [Actinomycetota bacterium]|nr:1-acyl-sn-glycerol-3-phosphate acyltransferase [Actinomycetota bacterium]
MILYRFVRFLVQAVCRTYWRATFEGLEHVPRTGPFVLAPVHRSFIDFAIVSGVTKRRLRYMGKAELWKFRPFGALLSALGAFPVHRGAADREAFRRSLAVIEGGEPLVLFPEGTRRYGPVVENLHEGASYVAMRAGIPIVPVGIGGSERALQKGKRLPRPTRVHVAVGPPIVPPAVGERRSPSRRAMRELSEQLRVEIQRLFDHAQSVAGSPPSDR